MIDFLEFISASTIAKRLLATLAEQPSEDGLKAEEEADEAS